MVARETSTKIILTGSDPAANTEQDETIGATGDRFVYHIKSIFIPLVTDANVANRFPAIQITDESDNVFMEIAVATAVTASTTMNVEAVRGLDFATDGNGNEIVPLPEKLIVPGGYKIKTLTANLQATDNYGVMQVFGSKLYAL